jgi:hypothetical protein
MPASGRGVLSLLRSHAVRPCCDNLTGCRAALPISERNDHRQGHRDAKRDQLMAPVAGFNPAESRPYRMSRTSRSTRGTKKIEDDRLHLLQ